MMLRKLEEHNPARIGHGERVSSYAVATAFHLGLRGDDLSKIRHAAVLHDIWKLKFPRALLEKPSPLSAAELQQLRNGPAYASLFLAKFPEICEIISEIYNQNGPKSSRIIRACTIFDVMTTPQPWRQAMSEALALEELSRHCEPEIFSEFSSVQPLIQPLMSIQ